MVTLLCFIFYPPKEEVPTIDDVSLSRLLGDLTGLPFFENRPVFIKRIIGVSGDKIEIRPHDGVYVNQKKIQEPYCIEPASYALLWLADIGGRNVAGRNYVPYPGSTAPIVVPKDSLFLLGDNRNNSEDSHMVGFINRDRVISKGWLKITDDDLKPFN